MPRLINNIYEPLDLGDTAPVEPEEQNSSYLRDVWDGLVLGATSDVARTVTGLADLAGAAMGAETSLTQKANDAGLREHEDKILAGMTPETRAEMAEVERIKRESQEAGDGEVMQGLKTLGAYSTNWRALGVEAARMLPTSIIGGGIGTAGARGAASYATKRLTKDLVEKAGKRAANTSLSQSSYGAGIQAAAKEGRLLRPHRATMSPEEYKARITAARQAGREAPPTAAALEKANAARDAAVKYAGGT